MSTDNDRRENRAEIYDLMAKFDINRGFYEPGDIDPAIIKAMKYIVANTGLLGDYNNGLVQMAGVETIQWWARGRLFSEHNDLFHWAQQQDDLIIGIAGLRHNHPITGDPSAYAEIHAAHRWGYGDE